MANLGLSNEPVNRFDPCVNLARPAGGTARHKLQTVINVALFSAAFIFVAAVVCGVLV
jgi:hypothetical protein